MFLQSLQFLLLNSLNLNKYAKRKLLVTIQSIKKKRFKVSLPEALLQKDFTSVNNPRSESNK